MSRYPSDRKVYVGDLGNNARKNELEYAFGSYGTLRSVWIARNPPGFAFVEFEDARDAADAVRGLDGRTVCGRRARVELSSGKLAGGGRSDRRGGGGGGRGGSGGSGGGGGGGGGDRNRGGRPFNPDDKCYECGGRGHYARDCRKYGRSRRRSHSRSRSRSYSRGHRSRSASNSRSRSVSPVKDSRKLRDNHNVKSRENGRSGENGDSRYSEDNRNGGAISPSPKRRYDDSSPSPKRNSISKRGRSDSRRRGAGGISLSRSRSSSRKD